MIEAEMKQEQGNKKTILMLGDLLTAPSGVAHALREIAFALLRSDKYRILQLGGGQRHQHHNPMKTEEFGDDLIMLPVDGYGTPEIVRHVIFREKPDLLLYQTDPRFWTWLHNMSDEILPHLPMLWYLVWDAKPDPKFLRPYFRANSHIACISKLTYDIVKNVAPMVESSYVPHAVNHDIFRRYAKQDIDRFRHEMFGDRLDGKFVLFYNSRNAKRKQTGTLILWFKEFLESIGDPKGDTACLIMKTHPKDEAGQDLYAIVEDFNLLDGQVLFVPNMVPHEVIAMLNNVADVGVLISHSEGFGYSVGEALLCEKPMICTRCGGIQDQAIDKDGQEFGACIPPVVSPVVGSQMGVPYIYDHHISKENFLAALGKLYHMSAEERDEIGRKGREHMMENFNYENYGRQWVELVDHVIEKNGSWVNRKGYRSWEAIDVRRIK